MSRVSIPLPLLAVTGAVLLAGCPKDPQVPQATEFAMIEYPEARRSDVSDDYFGTTVADPYRWLEDPDSEESRSWIQAQNTLTEGWLSQVVARAGIRARVEQLWNYERYGVPQVKAGKYFVTHNNGLQNQSVLYVADSLDGDLRQVLDPNTIRDDGTAALAGWSVNKAGTHLAYAIAEGGSDWNTWRVRDVATGVDLADTLEWVKFSGVSWLDDGTGFFYSRYDAPTEGDELQDVNLNQKLYFHRVGTEQAADILVYRRPDEPQWGFDADVSEDGSRLFIQSWMGTEEKNRVFLFELADLDLDAAGRENTVQPATIFGEFDAQYILLGDEGDDLWFYTNHTAPRGRIIKVSASNPAPDGWTEVVPESEDTLQSASLVGEQFVVTYLHDAHSRVARFALDGTHQGDVVLPGIGTAGGFSGERDATETFYYFTGFTTPTTILRFDLTSNESATFRAPKVDFNGDDFETSQVFYESKDGTRIPMFLVHKKGVEPTGDVPTWLYGYGGFNIPITPSFRISNAVWLEMGGLIAIANLRGGGEYGQEWHHQGTKLQKQNVFDDFISAGEHLIAQGWTRPDRLAVEGRSNGGLLIGACITQRPDLFGAAIPGVGVLDMLRYHKFTIGWAWASDYGTSEDDEEMFNYLLGYSPVHNLPVGIDLPPTMVMTADHDDRVVPAHSFKFAAAAQHAHSGAAPVLIRIETRGGHGAGKPTDMQIDEVADKWAFVVGALNMDVADSLAE